MIQRIVAENRKGRALGITSVCSAHPWVLEAALAQALDDGAPALIESTSNQVNQFGGYTGMTPAQFADDLRSLADRMGLPPERLVLGGDHLGPYPWRKRPAGDAMEYAKKMVRDYVLAGYTKIHLDASMPCADDPPGALDLAVAAQRAAELCRAAEEAASELPPGSPAPLYVIGTEVPVPGGEQLESGAPAVTKIDDAEATLRAHEAAFAAIGRAEAIERVIGLVVQPGVEFGSSVVFGYDRARAAALSAKLPKRPELVYEAHSTDYQTAGALREMAEDHFAILKVGPWLTFAMREAIFALSMIEKEWLGGNRPVRLSRVREALENAMQNEPAHWKDYYKGTEEELRFARLYSYSDRCRYYWPDSTVKAELDVLVGNLTRDALPPALLSQFLPRQYEAVRNGTLTPEPAALIKDRVRDVLRIYASACRG